MSKGYTYILRCRGGKYYVGSTANLEQRLQQHQSGEGGNFTSCHLPLVLVYYEEYSSIEDAFYRERRLHGWNRAKKEALIKGDIEQLQKLSKTTRKAVPNALEKVAPELGEGK